jgi:hypothetical protein
MALGQLYKSSDRDSRKGILRAFEPDTEEAWSEAETKPQAWNAKKFRCQQMPRLVNEDE